MSKRCAIIAFVLLFFQQYGCCMESKSKEIKHEETIEEIELRFHSLKTFYEWIDKNACRCDDKCKYKKVTSLTLSVKRAENVKGDEMVTFADALKKLKNLTRFTLSFAWKNLESHDLRSLVDVLKELVHLTFLNLNLGHNKIKEEGFILLIDALRLFVNLDTLALFFECNPFDQDGILHFMREFNEQCSFPRLHHLYINLEDSCAFSRENGKEFIRTVLSMYFLPENLEINLNNRLLSDYPFLGSVTSDVIFEVEGKEYLNGLRMREFMAKFAPILKRKRMRDILRTFVLDNSIILLLDTPYFQIELDYYMSVLY
jgi:hypothetical protein